MTGKNSSDNKAVQLPKQFEDRAVIICKKYPDQKSAVMPLLYLAQEHFGFVSDEAVLWVSSKIDMAPIHVREVATFYTMYYKKKVGKYHFQVCRTLSCAVRGAKKISEHLHKRFNVLPGEVSEDGMWSFEEVECLGSCGTAPMCELNDIYCENLSVEKLDTIIDRIVKESPDMRCSTAKDCLGDGLSGLPKSEVI